MLFNHRLKTFKMGKKARSVTIGERGKEAIFITPNPKPVVEVHFWVIKNKLSRALGVCLALILGYLAASISFEVLVGLCILGFIWGIATGGDVETSPG